MTLKILCVGDVVGQPGRTILRGGIPALAAQQQLDCVIVNAENVAGGSGLTAALYEKLRSYGANLITLGDHIYRRKEIIPVLEKSNCTVRPVNFPPGAPGREFAVYQTQRGHGVAVMCVLGRLFMKQPLECPFRSVDRVLSAIPKEIKAVVVDVHAEATSEKIALGWHLDGRVSVIFGTHTHVPTADERILPGGTAYITDVGMTGPYDSVLGRRKDRVLSAMINGVPTPFDVANEDVQLCGVVATVDAGTGRALAIERVQWRDQGGMRED